MFKNLWGKKKTDSTGIIRPERLSSAVESSIFNTVGAKAIQPMPGAAQRAFQLSTDPNAEAHQYIEVIESDEALAGRIVKIANSVYFERGKKSSTIEEAVLVIGIDELRSLLNATTLSEIFPSRSPLRAQCWANDIGTAIIAKVLAQRLLPAKKDAAFLAGLMHDVGKLLLIQRASDLYLKAMKLVEEQALSFAEAEAQVFVFDHTEVGQLVAERWAFSDEIAAVIRTHHQPFPAEAPATEPLSLPILIKCADIIAHALGLGHSKGMHRFRQRCGEALPDVWRALRLASPKDRELLADFQRAYDYEYDLYAGNAR
jgi:putative nucleotidyltransferase with HDIG domain